MIEALYIHIPFCASRCAYCDFATNACDDEERMDAYVDALCVQLRRAAKAGLLGGVKTIFIGGGTPTHLGMRRLNTLIYTISLSINLENVVEFTIEANPESLDERMVVDLYALGVNRFSIGAQSFDDEVLAGYGRIHDAKAIDEALAVARTRTDNVSVDLICGGPAQTMESWKASVAHVIEQGIPHVSVYPLMLEEGSPLAGRVVEGSVQVADEELQAEMMLAAQNMLEEAGLVRYEVASYAKPGFECLHNIAYWSGKEYLGIGAGAASMLSGEMAMRARDVGLIEAADLDAVRVRYVCDVDDVAYAAALGCVPVDCEILSAYEAQVEDLMLGMRRSIGVSREEVECVAGAAEVFARLEELGLVAYADGRLVPTQRGWLMGNEVFAAIWDLAM